MRLLRGCSAAGTPLTPASGRPRPSAAGRWIQNGCLRRLYQSSCPVAGITPSTPPLLQTLPMGHLLTGGVTLSPSHKLRRTLRHALSVLRGSASPDNRTYLIALPPQFCVDHLSTESPWMPLLALQPRPGPGSARVSVWDPKLNTDGVCLPRLKQQSQGSSSKASPIAERAHCTVSDSTQHRCAAHGSACARVRARVDCIAGRQDCNANSRQGDE
jgi:hypothetical protein